MPRAKRGNKRLHKRKGILKLARGYRGTKSKLYRHAKEQVERSLNFAFTGRKLKKRDFRSLWIVRIGAAARANGLSYSQFMHGLKLAEIGRLSDQFAAQAETLALERDTIDISLPGTRPRQGHLHPITLVRQRIEDVFVSMGYSVEDGPEIETSFYNFDALNIPPGHPARESADTFYVSEDLALRSQTSTVQIHTMQGQKPPLRVIAPGRVFRRDTPDPTHNPMFFQVEGLNVDRNITLADLKGTLQKFVEMMFGPGVRTRFRPSYFPFTEPSAEVDFSCYVCGGTGCRICKGSGWIELGGSGMVHPNVLETVGIDPEEFSGFAVWVGIDRIGGLMYVIHDIRMLV